MICSFKFIQKVAKRINKFSYFINSATWFSIHIAYYVLFRMGLTMLSQRINTPIGSRLDLHLYQNIEIGYVHI